MQLCGGSSGLAPEGRTDILTVVALQLRSPVSHSADQSYLWIVSVESISRTWGMEASTEVRSVFASLPDRASFDACSCLGSAARRMLAAHAAATGSWPHLPYYCIVRMASERFVICGTIVSRLIPLQHVGPWAARTASVHGATSVAVRGPARQRHSVLLFESSLLRDSDLHLYLNSTAASHSCQVRPEPPVCSLVPMSDKPEHCHDIISPLFF